MKLNETTKFSFFFFIPFPLGGHDVGDCEYTQHQIPVAENFHPFLSGGSVLGVEDTPSATFHIHPPPRKYLNYSFIFTLFSKLDFTIILKRNQLYLQISI